MSSQKTDNAQQYWDRHRNTIHSRKGGWKIGQAVFSHGYSLMDDLVGEASYFQIMMMNVLGYLPEQRVAEWLEASFICMSWPDPRIWCNQIGALAGTTQTKAVAATTAGILAADSTMYGSRPLLDGVTFIQDVLKRKKAGATAEDILKEEIKKHRGKIKITGYARPIASGDERVIAMERVTRQLGFERGEHLTLAMELDQLLKRGYGESININGYVSAFLSDQGYSAENIYRICALCVMSGVMACFSEEQSKRPFSFLPLRCDDIEYHGKEQRAVPEK
jgi:citrate synthase